ncbi:hypothetical protein BUY35_00075 [Staphylococcus cohnii]|uniref:Uncharacterized protein n=1 Tax=Staphylococcus kloosii TaxID=29384 RepID=A0A921GZW4_9STAP|nr:hypothetical protein [Staphylococcus kloosii]RIM32718.1 hypothetical protein BUY35_00075 [Staphylococcus cohnii]HJF67951.1 hypothetical protein [Staphylococcus kloosii]
MQTTYLDLRKEHSKELNSFPMFFAFDEKQFEEGLAKIGATKEDKLVHIGGGGYIKKDQLEAFKEMLERHNKQHQDNMVSDEDYTYHMVKYELANHEYLVSYDLEPTLEACNITKELLNANTNLKNTVNKAIKDYKAENDII